MKSAMFALFVAAMIVGSSGCRGIDPLSKGGSSEAAGCATCGGGPQYQPGPPSAQVANPYYTLHGPRDFLARDPRSVGR